MRTRSTLGHRLLGGMVGGLVALGAACGSADDTIGPTGDAASDVVATAQVATVPPDPTVPPTLTSATGDSDGGSINGDTGAAALEPSPSTEPNDDAAPGSDPDRTAPTEGANAASATAAPDPPTSTPLVIPTATSVPLRNFDPRAITVKRITTLDDAIAMAARPGSEQVFVARQTGEIHRLEHEGRGEWTTIDEPALSVADRTIASKERGLLGMTFSPDGGRLFIVYTDRADNANVLVEYQMTFDEVDASSAREILRVDQPFVNHNGGHIVFGPDGLLYYGLGDGGSGGDPLGHGQNADTLLGSILRLDVSDPSAGAYLIPDDNPYAEGGGAPEIWMTGLRNPWRFAFDVDTGDLWVADVGQREIEEITRVAPERARGANLGWNLFEGFEEFNPGEPTAGTLVAPLFTYPHEEGRCSITGGLVYRGEAFPELRGAYVYGDYCTGEIFALASDGATVTNRRLSLQFGTNALASFGEDPFGELWALTLGGAVVQFVPEQ